MNLDRDGFLQLTYCTNIHPADGWDARLPPPLAAEYESRRLAQPLDVHARAAGGIVVMPLTALAISASDIRARLRTAPHRTKALHTRLPPPHFPFPGRDPTFFARGP